MRAARIGSIERIARNNFHASCFLASANNSSRSRLISAGVTGAVNDKYVRLNFPGRGFSHLPAFLQLSRLCLFGPVEVESRNERN
jgi:hypothetical protein